MIYNFNEIQLYTSIRKEKFKITSWQLRLNTKAKTKRKLKIYKDCLLYTSPSPRDQA